MKFNKRVTICSIILCLFILGCYLISSHQDIDYKEIYGDFISNKLEDFYYEHQNQIEEAADEGFKAYRDSYMIDIDNDKIPELFNIFCSDFATYTMIVKYDGKFDLYKKLDFDSNTGSGGSIVNQILKGKDNKIYIYSYKSGRLEYGENSRWSEDEKVILWENGDSINIYSRYSDDGLSHYVNGVETDEYDFNYVNNNYEIILDSGDYTKFPFSHTIDSEPLYGKNYDKYWNQK